ncbi:MAG: hypothetical protein ABJL44_19145 [Algibacter sp.]
MKKILILCLFFNSTVFSQNIGSTGNTWYKINSKGTYITKVKASGHYAEHDVIVHIINNYWNTAEVQYISEFNYNHNRIKLEWGHIGSGSNRYMAVRNVPVTANYASSFELTNIADSSFDYALEAIDASLVTVITPKTQLFVDEWTGNVGIGRTPGTNSKIKLSVNGGIRINGANAEDNNSPALMSHENDDFLYDDQYINRYAVGFHNYQDPSSSANGLNTYMAGYFGLDFFTTNSNRMRINHNGNVGIGTTTPDEKLAVNGNIHTKEVRVDLIGWSDFVFDKSYNLPSLKQVENHIKENGHLKDIPSAEDVAENGILLGDMDAKLLQKIEELTLYTIQQEKKIETQEKTNQELKKRLLRLEQLVLNQ